MSSVSTMSVDAGNKSISSHRLDTITPDSLTPQSGSPDSAQGYSPHSQPFAQRPTSLTSAGAAVRQSASTLPSPPPFTPCLDSRTEQASPVAFANYSASSCGSQDPSTETPGVTSAWATSSTKPKQQQAESFAFPAHGTTAASSPDVDHFQATSNVTPPPPAALLDRASQGITTSAEVDAASECSETASRSSVTSRGSSRRFDGQSPGDLLRKAKVIFEKRAAIEGSSRLRHNKKLTIKTPLDKGIPATVTPHNTPMDVQLAHHGDQASVLESPAVCAGDVTAADTPGSVTGPVSAPLESPDDRKVLSSSKVPSPPDSAVSVVSIGSVCPTADVGRKLDFSTMPTPADPEVTGGSSSPSACSPVPLNQFANSMEDSVTKRNLNTVLDDMREQETFLFTATGSPAVLDMAKEPDLASAFAGPVSPKEAPSGWLNWSAHALLYTLAFVGVCTAGFLAVELLPPGTSGPGMMCTPYDAQACLAAHRAYWASDAGPRDLPRWRVVIKQIKWHMQDAWDSLILRKMPAGVTEADLVKPFISRITEKQQQEMPIELAQQLFGDMSAVAVPPIIAARLGADQVAVTAQQLPEELVAVTGAQLVLPEQHEKQQHADAQPAAEQEQTAPATDTAGDETDGQYAATQIALEGNVDEAVLSDQSPLDAAYVEQYEAPEADLEPQEQQALLVPDSTEQDSNSADAHQQDVSDVIEVAVAKTEEPTVMVEANIEPPLQAAAAAPTEQRPAAGAWEEQELDAAALVAETPGEPAAQLDAAAAQPETSAASEGQLQTLFNARPGLQEQLEAASELSVTANVAPEERDLNSELSSHSALSNDQVIVEQAVNKSAGLHYLVGVVAATLLSIIACFALRAVTVGMRFPTATAVSQIEPSEDVAGGVDLTAEHEAGEQEAAEQEAAQPLEAALGDGLPAEEEQGGILTDEEWEPQAQSTPKHTSAAALLDAAITAGASTVEKVHKVLRFKETPSPIQYYSADRQTAAQRTPRAAATRSSGRTPRAASSRRTRSTVAAEQDDGEEVQQAAPVSTGKGRKTTRGRKSTALPEVPENMPADDGALLSDEELQVKASTRGRRSQKMAAEPELEVASGKGRRRLSAPTASEAAEATTPARTTRRGSRTSQG